jgi:hypothetical protein
MHKPVIGQKMFVIPRDRHDISKENRIDGLYVEGEVVKVGTKYFDVKATFKYADWAGRNVVGSRTYTFAITKNPGEVECHREANDRSSKAYAYASREALVEEYVTRPALLEKIRAVFGNYGQAESVSTADLQVIEQIINKPLQPTSI